MSEQDLSPCPMCGAIEDQNGVWLNRDGYISCQTCRTSSRDFDTNAEAIAAWNKRSPQPGAALPVASHAALLAEVEALRKEKERLDWLESEINAHGAIHLHDGQHPHGHGIGLRPGAMSRTLRAAIDTARRAKEQDHG